MRENHHTHTSSSSSSYAQTHLAGSCKARYGAMLQARLTLSFHCFSVRLMYLDLQLAMLVSTDCSADIWSSWLPRGLYHVVKRSTSLAYTHKTQWHLNQCDHTHHTDLILCILTSRASSSVLRFMKYLCSCVPLFVFFDRPENRSQCYHHHLYHHDHQAEEGENTSPDFLESVETPLDSGYVLIQPCVTGCLEPMAASRPLLESVTVITDRLFTDTSWGSEYNTSSASHTQLRFIHMTSVGVTLEKKSKYLIV